MKFVGIQTLRDSDALINILDALLHIRIKLIVYLHLFILFSKSLINKFAGFRDCYQSNII